ncbi:HD domain-containing protein [Candidatus Pacearchaeota archaeon]|nr:HD domain-containing protein [Candidatus Pacearchaeota archaeon]
MIKQDYTCAKKEAIKLLQGLDESYHYHDLFHTEDVLRGVKELAGLEKINEHGTLLLKTAAIYHDIGYLSQSQGHEKIGAEAIKKILPNYGYNQKDIELISEIILATQMPQNPQTNLQEIICDADLDNLGREDFFVRGELLRSELAKQGIQKTDKEWYEFSLKFLQGHNYFTESAKTLRQKKKEQNIQEIKDLLGIN